MLAVPGIRVHALTTGLRAAADLIAAVRRSLTVTTHDDELVFEHECGNPARLIVSPFDSTRDPSRCVRWVNVIFITDAPRTGTTDFIRAMGYSPRDTYAAQCVIVPDGYEHAGLLDVLDEHGEPLYRRFRYQADTQIATKASSHAS